MPSSSGSDGLWAPKPPDGGWGWVVVFAAFSVNFIWGGLFNSYGILYKEFLTYFGQSRGYTSLIGSILNGLGYGAGILASGLMNRYGIRAVAVIGGAIGGVCCALCMFADSVAALIVLFGGGVGFGHALSYTAAYIITPYYFEQRRGMATGVALAGSGVGNMVCAPLMRYLLSEYTWRGFVVIQGGIILQCCVFGALFRPVPVVRLSAPSDESDKRSVASSEGSVVEEAKEGEECKFKRSRIYSDTTDYFRKARSSLLPAIPEAEGGDRLHGRRTFSLDAPYLARRFARRGTKEYANKPFSRKDIYYANSLRRLDEYRSNPDVYWREALAVPREDQSPRQRDTAFGGAGTGAGSSLYSRLDEMMGLSLLRKGEFVLFSLAIFALYFGYYVPYTVLYDFALERGVPDTNAVVLVSIMGVANTAGRILLGSVADIQCVNRLRFFSFIMFLIGASCCFCTFYTNFYVMAVFAAVFAIGVGASKALTVIVTVDLLGLENLTNAYGLLLLFQGLGFILGNPFAGWLHDVTNSYVVPFSIIGAVLIASGVLILLAPWVKKRNERAGAAQPDCVDAG